MAMYLAVFVALWLAILLAEALEKRRFRKALHWMVVSMRCGHLEVCDETLCRFPEQEAAIREQIALVFMDLRRSCDEKVR